MHPQAVDVNTSRRPDDWNPGPYQPGVTTRVIVEPAEGLEPPTSCLQDRRSTKLSYTGLVHSEGLEPSHLYGYQPLMLARLPDSATSAWCPRRESNPH